MATEYPRLGSAQLTNPAAQWQLAGTRTRDLFEPGYADKQALWKAWGEGKISDEEAQRQADLLDARSGRQPAKPVGLARDPSKPRPPVSRPRALRPAPLESRQYANPVATTAARDDRLTPQAKALLQILRARAGKGTETSTTKGTLAATIARSTRSVCRYLRDLERWGYIETRTRMDHRGYHLGLVITITEKVMPFFHDLKRLGRWLGETAGISPLVPYMPFATTTRASAPPSGLENKGMTFLSPNNPTPKDSTLGSKNGWGVMSLGRKPRPN